MVKVRVHGHTIPFSAVDARSTCFVDVHYDVTPFWLFVELFLLK